MPAAAQQLQLKATYRATSKLQVFYTGGAARLTRDGKLLACSCSDEVKIVEVATGAVMRSIKPDGEAVTAVAVSPDCRTLVVATRSLYVRVYDMTTGAQLRSWRGHKAPVADLAIDASGGYVATASADRSVKVWDLAGGFCTHNFSGGHGGVVLRAMFHPKLPQLFTAADDGSVRVWNLEDKSCVYDLKAHFSAVTSLALSPDGWLLLTSGRDKVVVVWDLRSGAKVTTVPVFEAVEGLVALPLGSTFPGVPRLGSDTAAVLKGSKKHVFFATAGERGAIKLWSSETGGCVAEVAPEVAVAGSAACELTDLALLPAAATPGATGPGLLAATADARLLFYTPQDVDGARRLVLARQLIGNQDQVTDLRFVGPPSEPSLLAVATNSETVRLYGMANMSCAASLVGHRDIVLCLDGGAAIGGMPALLASGSKDNEVRLWEATTGRCLGLGVGHVGAVNGVAMSRKSHRFLVSVGSDKLIKVWDTTPALAFLATANGQTDAAANGGGGKKQKTAAAVPASAASGLLQLRTLAAVAGHDKDINAVAVAPNDQLVATASQDRTVRLWSLPDLVQVSTLRGHKRGVWAVEFAPLERALLTASGDKTIKLWSLTDQSCLRTLEGHTASVLRAVFLTAGTQILSAGADGVLKLWNVASGECVNTFDEHEDKIWALTVGGAQEGLVATGGGDALVCLWADSTEADAVAAAAAEEELAEKEQALQNALADSDFGRAARLAFSLKHPGRLLSIITRAATTTANAAAVAADADLRVASSSAAGPLGRLLTGLVSAMSDEDLKTSLEYCRDWNTNAKHCHAAQALLGAMLRAHSPEKLLGVQGLADLLAALTAYSGRHFSRLDRLVRSTYLVDFTLESMGVLGVGGGGDGDEGEEGVSRVGDEDEEGALLARLAAARVGQKRARAEEEEEEEEEEGQKEEEEEEDGGKKARVETEEEEEEEEEGEEEDSSEGGDMPAVEIDVTDDEEDEGEEQDEEEAEEKADVRPKMQAIERGPLASSADALEDDFGSGFESLAGDQEGEESEEDDDMDEGAARMVNGAEGGESSGDEEGAVGVSEEESEEGSSGLGDEDEEEGVDGDEDEEGGHDDGEEEGGVSDDLSEEGGSEDSDEEGDEEEEEGEEDDVTVALERLRKEMTRLHAASVVAGSRGGGGGGGGGGASTSRANMPDATARGGVAAAAQRGRGQAAGGSKSLGTTPVAAPRGGASGARPPATAPSKGPRSRMAAVDADVATAGRGSKAVAQAKELRKVAQALDLPRPARGLAAAGGPGAQRPPGGGGGKVQQTPQALKGKQQQTPQALKGKQQQTPQTLKGKQPQQQQQAEEQQQLGKGQKAGVGKKAASAPSTPVAAKGAARTGGGKGGGRPPVGSLTGPAKKARRA